MLLICSYGSFLALLSNFVRQKVHSVDELKNNALKTNNKIINLYNEQSKITNRS